MNGMRKTKGLITALLGLILPLVLVAMTLSLGHAQGPGEPYLVKDIWPGPDSSDEANWDYDCNPAAVNGMFLFLANDGTHGDEVWRSDGTEADTLLVEDIVAGSGSPFHDFADCAAVNDLFFFYADDGIHGREVWRSNGTAEGTLMFKDSLPGVGFLDAGWPAAVDNILFFGADDGIHGWELWMSDGTAEGTVMVRDIVPGPGGSWPSMRSAGDHQTVVDGALFFVADDGTHGGSCGRATARRRARS